MYRSSHIWFAPKDAYFYYLAFEIQYPQNSIFDVLKRELLMHWIFLYLHHIPVLFLSNIPFSFFKKRFTSTLDIPERQTLMNVTWTFWGQVILFHVQTQRRATLCYAVARTGPREIMYSKIKMHQLTSLPLPLINDRSLSIEGSRLEKK